MKLFGMLISLMPSMAFAIINGTPLPETEIQLNKTVVYLRIYFDRPKDAHVVSCTGSYVSEDTILTAAHCFEKMLTSDEKKNVNNFRVFVTRSQTVEISKGGLIVYDEMADRLSDAAMKNTYAVTPVFDKDLDLAVFKAPRLNDSIPLAIGTRKTRPSSEVALIGYGFDNNTIDCLNHFIMLSDPACSSGNRIIGYSRLSSMHKGDIFTMPTEIGVANKHANAGPGDSGGPLLEKINGVWSVIGVASQVRISSDSFIKTKYKSLSSKSAISFLKDNKLMD